MSDKQVDKSDGNESVDLDFDQQQDQTTLNRDNEVE
jgi:hypothetical protein